MGSIQHTWTFETNRLEQLRDLHELTVDETAALISVHRDTWLNWERGKTAPTAEKLVALANSLRIDPRAFFRKAVHPLPKDSAPCLVRS